MYDLDLCNNNIIINIIIKYGRDRRKDEGDRLHVWGDKDNDDDDDDDKEDNDNEQQERAQYTQSTQTYKANVSIQFKDYQ